MPRRRISDFLDDPPAPGTSATPAPVASSSPAKASGRALVPTQAPAAPGGPGAATPNGTALLAAELNDVARALDVVGGVVASVANRVDRQTQVLEQVSMNSAEARAAAFTARDQSNPEFFEKAISDATEASLRPTLSSLHATARVLEGEKESIATLKSLVMDGVRERQARAKFWARWRLPMILGLLLLLLLVLPLLLVVLPRFLVLNSDLCWLYGGIWLRYDTSLNDACVFQTGW